jgi:hypothetical protein
MANGVVHGEVGLLGRSAAGLLDGEPKKEGDVMEGRLTTDGVAMGDAIGWGEGNERGDSKAGGGRRAGIAAGRVRVVALGIEAVTRAAVRVGLGTLTTYAGRTVRGDSVGGGETALVGAGDDGDKRKSVMRAT